MSTNKQKLFKFGDLRVMHSLDTLNCIQDSFEWVCFASLMSGLCQFLAPTGAPYVTHYRFRAICRNLEFDEQWLGHCDFAWRQQIPLKMYAGSNFLCNTTQSHILGHIWSTNRFHLLYHTHVPRRPTLLCNPIVFYHSPNPPWAKHLTERYVWKLHTALELHNVQFINWNVQFINWRHLVYQPSNTMT